MGLLMLPAPLLVAKVLPKVVERTVLWAESESLSSWKASANLIGRLRGIVPLPP